MTPERLNGCIEKLNKEVFHVQHRRHPSGGTRAAIRGEKPTVRKVRAMLGCGSQGRIAAVLKELHLPEPKPSEPEIPPYLVDALRRDMLEGKAAGEVANQYAGTRRGNP